MNLNNAATSIWNGIYIFVAFIIILIAGFYARPQGGGGFKWGIFIGGFLFAAIFVAIMFRPGNVRSIGDTILGWFGL